MFKRLGLIFALILVFTQLASAADVTITGKIVTPTTSIGVVNGTLNMALNQAAVKVGSFSVAASNVACYTSADGSVVGVPNPVIAPVAVAAAGAGSLSGTYTVKITYVSAAAATETLASPLISILVTGPSNSIVVSAPVLQPAGAVGYRVYVGTSAGNETLQATTLTWVSTTINSVSSGGALPSSNNTVCSVVGNDTLIPFGTKYLVNLSDVNGTQVSGFPMYWYLAGASWDMANGYPLAGQGIQTRFPTPILANPSSNALQSVNSPLTLNGYALTAGSLLLPDNASPSACSAGRAVLYEDASTHNLMGCQNGSSAVAILNATGLWTRSAPSTILANANDRVLLGPASAGDFASSAPPYNYNSALITTNFLYAASGNSNGSLIGIGYDASSVTTRLASGKTSAGGSYVPLAVLTNGAEQSRWDLSGRFLQNLTSTDVSETHSIVSSDGIYVVSADTNASLGGMVYDSGSGTFRLVSGITGSGTPRPMAFVLYDDLATANVEAARFIKTANLGSTARVFNLQVGLTSAQNYNDMIVAERDQDTASQIVAINGNNSGAASASFRAFASATPGLDVTMGVTSPTFTTTNGIVQNEAFIIAGGPAINGLALQANAGSVKVLSGATVVATFGGGSPAFNSPLANTSGGTGAAAAFAGGGIPYAAPSSTTVLATSSNFTFDGTNRIEAVVGGVAIASDTRHNPAGGVSYLHMFYDAGVPNANIVAVDYTGPTYKNLKISGLTVGFAANGTDVFSITSNGPAWAAGFGTNIVAGANTLSLANMTFPGSVGGIPYVMFKAIAPDGTVVYIPAWK